jgi:hypothetical protein
MLHRTVSLFLLPALLSLCAASCASGNTNKDNYDGPSEGGSGGAGAGAAGEGGSGGSTQAAGSAGAGSQGGAGSAGDGAGGAAGGGQGGSTAAGQGGQAGAGAGGGPGGGGSSGNSASGEGGGGQGGSAAAGGAGPAGGAAGGGSGGGGSSGSGGSGSTTGAGGAAGASSGSGGAPGPGGSAGAAGVGGAGGGSSGNGGTGGAAGGGGDGGSSGNVGTGGAPGGAGGSSGSSGAGGSAGGGPVDMGFYTYKAVPTYNIVNPPAAAWHPSGGYALVLANVDKLYRFDPSDDSLTEVGSAGAAVSLRDVVFTPDGSRAIVLASSTKSGVTQARLFAWDAATASLAEMPTEQLDGYTYQALAFSPDGTEARLLASKPNAGSYLAYVWPFDPMTGRDVTKVKATATSAECQDLAFATDGFGAPAVAVVCGGNGVDLFYIDKGGGIQKYPSAGSAGNVSRIAARPQGDYALAIGWSGQKVYRFQQGGWDTSFGSPKLPGIFDVAFSTNGERALLFGSKGSIYEFRHDLLAQSEIGDVSIGGFSAPPYNATPNAHVNGVAWRPGCDGGILVAGESSFSAKMGIVIRFAADNGAPCQN